MIPARQWSAVVLRRPLVPTPPRARLAPRIATRASSLSAIHRGLRRSVKAQYGDQGENPRAASADRPRLGRNTSASLTERALEGARSDRQRHKLRKKLARKAEEKQKEEESGRQTRRKRFLDPESKFGKKSLVYQLKHGALKDTAAQLPLPEPVRLQSFRSKERERRALRDESGEARSRSFERATPRRGAEESLDVPERERRALREELREARSRPFERALLRRGADESLDVSLRERRAGRDRRGRDDRRDIRQRFDETPYRARRNADDGPEDEGRPTLRRKRVMMPMTIKYTTAASQFLYGKSVVQAALQQERRKLYKLYIYGGENRKDLKENAIMTNLAERRGVPIAVVPTEEQRIMDKMSMGRPHNGFVLETSPLPKAPVKSLGKLEETPSKLGFHVELDHQSKEEEAVNGTDTFIPRANDLNPKPFVLLLNEILDPGNLGAALRTASYLGVDAVGITNRSSSHLTPVVLKSAAGAVEEITIFTVDSPVDFIEASKSAGWKTYAAVPPPDRKLAKKHKDKFLSMETVEQDTPLSNDPCVLILGNEGYGLSKPLKVAADYQLSVPRFVQNSCVDSLNVSVAAALLCHAFIKEPVVAKGAQNERPATGEESADSKENDDEALF